jgi:predicted O-methyltransferase YrrM
MRTPNEDLLSKYLDELVPDIGIYEKKSREASVKLGLQKISLSRGEAHVLRWMTQSKSAKKAVEIGTLTGLSGLYILAGLAPGGQLWTLEKSDLHAAVAEPILKNYAQDLGKNVEVIRGDARETLVNLGPSGPFDLIFIDGNKAAYGDYLIWAEENLKSGGILVADNVLLGGSVYSQVNSNFSDKQINVMKKFNQRLMETKIWRGALLPTGEGLFVAEKI